MKERFVSVVTILLLVGLVIDLYAYKGVRLLTAEISNQKIRIALHVLYWVISLIFAGLLLYVFVNREFFTAPQNNAQSFFITSILLMMFVSKLIFAVFHGIDDLVHLFRNIYAYVVHFFSPPKVIDNGQTISRAKFLTYLGAAAFTLTFSSVFYGIFKGRFNFRILTEKLGFKNLPQSFKGFKIVQISDLHIGSFPKFHQSVEEAVKMINNLKPDIIVFTGDMVNNLADEMEGWQPIFQKLEAKYGKFSILGNHDYADYIKFENPDDKIRNLKKLMDIQKEIGFDLILNSNREIEINGEKIALIGVENWGKPPFKQYGNLGRALKGVSDNSLKILLSHDPSHWDAEVLQKTNIDLTLSGHTHGFQFGIEIPGIKWSPVKYRYPRWGGLYQEGEQYLYVNRGFGHIGFAGRVGMPPEITLIELV